MTNIQITILEKDTYAAARRLMVTAARLTQRNHMITCLEDLEALHKMHASDSLVTNLSALPHPTLQKFGTITIAIVGASRRFLAQITRHQNEVKFMSGSLQYSDMSGGASFMVPYELLGDAQATSDYLRECKRTMDTYRSLLNIDDIGHDSAAYIMPQGMRNSLLICATPYQWKHMIKQRVCRRNSDETRVIMLRIWSLLKELDPIVFGNLGPGCMTSHCEEGHMGCKSPLPKGADPEDILRTDYPLLYERYDVYPIK